METRVLNSDEFTRLCTQQFGQWGWQSKVAAILERSQSYVSNVKTGKIALTPQDQANLIRGLSLSDEQKNFEALASATQALMVPEEVQETDEEISDRLVERQKFFEMIIESIFNGAMPAAIISGPPGVSKSYTVTEFVNNNDAEADLRTGSISAVGLYKALWKNKDGGIIIFDDCDDVFDDQESLNLLKAALDSSKVRTICWSKNASWLENEGIEPKFEFQGSIIFLTNVDMQAHVEKSSKMSKHFGAIMSRSMYLDLGMHSRREILIKIRQIATPLLEDKKFKAKEIKEIVSFIEENMDRFSLFSLREVHKVSQLYRTQPSAWRRLCEIGLMKRTKK